MADTTTDTAPAAGARNVHLVAIGGTGMGSLAGLLKAKRTGQGTVVDAAICDGSVRFVSNDVSLAIWRALSTSRGAEAISYE